MTKQTKILIVLGIAAIAAIIYFVWKGSQPGEAPAVPKPKIGPGGYTPKPQLTPDYTPKPKLTQTQKPVIGGGGSNSTGIPQTVASTTPYGGGIIFANGNTNLILV